MAKRNVQSASFDDQLVLFRYFLHQLKLDSLSALGDKLNSSEYEGVSENGSSASGRGAAASGCAEDF